MLLAGMHTPLKGTSLWLANWRRSLTIRSSRPLRRVRGHLLFVWHWPLISSVRHIRVGCLCLTSAGCLFNRIAGSGATARSQRSRLAAAQPNRYPMKVFLAGVATDTSKQIGPEWGACCALEDVAIQVLVGFMFASVVCGLLAFRGFDNARVAKSWYFRPCLFFGCFLLPCSVAWAGIGLALKVPVVSARLLLFLVPTVAMWFLLYRYLVRSVVSRKG